MAEWALEIRGQWVELLRSGRKQVEVRAYPLPHNLIGQPILIVTPPDSAPLTQEGSTAPVSGLPDQVPVGLQGAAQVGCITFSSVKRYTDLMSFVADEHMHCVPENSPHAWQLVSSNTSCQI